MRPTVHEDTGESGDAYEVEMLAESVERLKRVGCKIRLREIRLNGLSTRGCCNARDAEYEGSW
jgi:hypothetical protein